MKLRNKLGVVLFIILALLIVINRLTIHRYNVVSGNGNPGLAAIFLLIPLLLWLSIKLVRYFSYNSFNKFFITALPIVILFNIWGFKYQYNKLKYIRSKLFENNISLKVVNNLTSGVTYYTNTVYFNHITLLMFISLISTIGITIGIVKSALSKKAPE